MNVDKPNQPELAKHDSSVLDLAFCMDCTGSMGSYIENARNVNISANINWCFALKKKPQSIIFTLKSIRQIVEEIVASEKSDVRLALVEYRDHPNQDPTFVTRPHDFTASVKEMKTWLDACIAQGG